MYNGRDDCIVTNWAIIRINLQSVNSRCCITLDTALPSVTQAGVGPQDSSEEKSGTGVKEYLSDSRN